VVVLGLEEEEEEEVGFGFVVEGFVDDDDDGGFRGFFVVDVESDWVAERGVPGRGSGSLCRWLEGEGNVVDIDGVRPPSDAQDMGWDALTE